MSIWLNNVRKNFNDTTKEKHWWAFFIAILASALMFLPFVIYDKGYFFFLKEKKR